MISQRKSCPRETYAFGLRMDWSPPKLSTVMTKGHNQSKNKQANPLPDKPKGKGQSEHLKNSAKKHDPDQGRNANEDQSGGTKGANNI